MLEVMILSIFIRNHLQRIQGKVILPRYMNEGDEGAEFSDIPSTIEVDSEPKVQPQLSGEPTVIHVNTGPQVAGGQIETTNAVAGLVLAILGLVTFLGGAAALCCGPSLCFTIPAMILVSSDKKKIEGTAHPDTSMINASNVINIISLILALLGLGMYLILILFMGGIGAL